MYRRTIFTVAAIAASLGLIVGMATVPFSQTAAADKGGQPNDSAQFGPASENFCERFARLEDHRDERVADDNPNNDNGAVQAFQNVGPPGGFHGMAC